MDQFDSYGLGDRREAATDDAGEADDSCAEERESTGFGDGGGWVVGDLSLSVGAVAVYRGDPENGVDSGGIVAESEQIVGVVRIKGGAVVVGEKAEAAAVFGFPDGSLQRFILRCGGVGRGQVGDEPSDFAGIVDSVIIDDTGGAVGGVIGGVVADGVEQIHTVDFGECRGFSVDDSGAAGKVATASSLFLAVDAEGEFTRAAVEIYRSAVGVAGGEGVRMRCACGEGKCCGESDQGEFEGRHFESLHVVQFLIHD
jgi:hypothetical protein